MKLTLPLVSAVWWWSCSGVIDVGVEHTTVPAIIQIAEAPLEHERPTRTVEGKWAAPVALWRQEGLVTVLDGDMAFQESAADFIHLPILSDGAPTSPGVVAAVAARGEGIILAGSGGLFYSDSSALWKSPLSSDFATESIRFVDAHSDTLWVTTDTEAVRVGQGQRRAVHVEDSLESGELQIIVGRSEGQALLIKGRSLYAVDFDVPRARVLARGLGRVTAFCHTSKSVLFGTEDGLIEVAADDSVTRRTLTTSQDTAQHVVDIDVLDERVLLVTQTQVIQLHPGPAVVVADVATPRPNALAAVDSGEVWFIDEATVVKLSNFNAIQPLSFEKDVKPFMVAHCQGCHATGANYAPVMNLEDYGTAKTNAVIVVARLTNATAPMPPPSAEVLTPQDYDVVLHWFEGGMLP